MNNFSPDFKILAVFTGGTISCSRKDGALSPDRANAELLLSRFAGVEFCAEFPYTILSENLGAEHLDRLGKILEGAQGKYDGIIVATGTDTLQYVSSFSALSLGLCQTPVVIVSANYPLSDSRSNGYDNFDAAVSFLRSGRHRGAFVSYKNTGDSHVCIHRGSELLPHATYSDSVFSLFGNVYGKVRDGDFTHDPGYTEHCDDSLAGRRPNGRVLYLKAHPGMSCPELNGEKAVLLEGYHSGTLPTDSEELRRLCKTAGEKNIPVYLTGNQEGFDYETKKDFERLGISSLPPMSPAAAYMRLWIK